MLKVSIIGAGKVGTALAVLLDRKGYKIVSVFSRTRASSETLAAQVKGCRVADSYQQAADAADLTFVTTPDGAIAGVVSQINWAAGKSVVHCSGADSTAILVPAAKTGAMVGCFHPLQTFAETRQAIENTPGTTFALEAAEPLLSTLKKMAQDLKGSWIILKAEDKVAYHTAAVFASNYLVTLTKMAADLWKTFSIPADKAIQAMLPLMRGTLHNIETVGLPDCLTGPIARGDSITVLKHIKELKEKSPSLLFPYQELGLQTIPIALAKGRIDEKKAGELELILKGK